jgi:cytochrome c oxidase assembly protein subunit 15
MKLFPAIVTLHLMGGMVLLALLARQAARLQAASNPSPGPHGAGRLRPWLVLGLALLGVQIALGGWVSTNYAVLVCDTFPMCQGSYWPEMAFEQGFQIWRPLGYNAWGELLSFQALTAIHYTHRLAAYAVIPGMLWLAWVMTRAGRVKHGRVLASLVLLQFITGLSNVVLGWPMVAAVMHTGGAAAMVVVLVLTWPRSYPPTSHGLFA